MGGRQLEFDIAKGIAILCVIVGHLDVVFLQHLVFLFHMPIFFLISGYRAAAVPAWLLWTAILVVKVVWATGMTCFVRRIPLFRSVYETR